MEVRLVSDNELTIVLVLKRMCKALVCLCSAK